MPPGSHLPESEASPILHEAGVGETWLETICRWLTEAAIATIIVVVGVDIVTRTFFRFSFEISDEIGGYMLAAIAFLSLPVCQAGNGFHHVEFVQARLGPRARAASHVVFDLLMLAFTGILLWQLAGFERRSFRFGEVAPTYLATPLWVPRLAIVIGVAVLFITLVRTLVADLRRLSVLRTVPARR